MSRTDAGTPLTREQQRLSRNVALVAASFALAALMGLLRNVIIARRFGIGAELDVYYAAFRWPDLLFAVLAGGALATAFIPVFAGVAALGQREAAWRLTSQVTNWAVLVVGSLAALSAIFAPWLVANTAAPGFSPAQQAQTAAAMRLVLISTVIFSISSVQTSALNGLKHFFWPSLAPVVYPLGVIIGAVWLTPTWGVRGLAAGAVLGSLFHLLVKVPALRAYGFRWWPVLDPDDHALRRVAVLMLPRIADLGLFHLTVLVTTNLASQLATGSVSALEWGWDAMQLPETVIGTAFGLVAFPTLAELAAVGDRPGLCRTLVVSLRTVIALALPATIALLILGRPLLAMVYQRGAFGETDTAAVFTALRFYALGLTAHACLELAARAFFAQEDTITPLLIAAVFAGTNIALGIVLMRPLGAAGLALANSLAVSGEVVALLWILRRRLGGIDARSLASALGRVGLASAAMAVSMIAVLGLAVQHSVPTAPAIVMAALGGLATYLVALRLVHVREVELLVAALYRR